jgi:hypothetical protein
MRVLDRQQGPSILLLGDIPNVQRSKSTFKIDEMKDIELIARSNIHDYLGATPSL